MAACSRDGVPGDVGTVDLSDDRPSPGDMAPGLPTVDLAGPWPRRITLTVTLDGTRENLRLDDGAVSPASADLDFNSGRVLSLRTPAGDGICSKGVFPSLGMIPTDTQACPGSPTAGWVPIFYLDAATIHTQEQSRSAGSGLLVRDLPGDVLYRARILGDSYGDGRSTVTLDYEPVP